MRVIHELKKQIQYFITNKIYMISLILATAAGYGYELTHGTMGIDDVCIELYFEDGLGVAIGRWPFYLINKIFRVTEFVPFLMDFIAVILMMSAAILLSSLLRYVVSKEISIFCYVIFSTLFVTYSLIAEVFIYYLQNGVPISYCLTTMAIFVFYYIQTNDLEKKQRLKYIVMMSSLMCITISFYESAANVFLSGVLLLMLIDLTNVNRMQMNTVKNCFWTLVLMARVLVYSIICRSIIIKLCMYFFKIKPYGVRDVGQVLWILEYPGRIFTIIKQIIRDYFIVGLAHFPIKLFVIATIFFAIGVIWITLKRKNIFISIISIALYTSLFILSFFYEDAVPYRANQMLAVFVAFVFFVISCLVMKSSKTMLKYVAVVLLISVVYNSIYDLNRWFTLDYKKNQIELEVIHNVAHELETGGYDIKNKPVVFIGEYRMNPAILEEYTLERGSLEYELVKYINESMDEKMPMSYPYTQSLSESLINWGIKAFNEYEGYNRELIRIFEKEGYTFTHGGNELYQKAVGAIENQERYPVEGYIKEYHDCVIVRF